MGHKKSQSRGLQILDLRSCKSASENCRSWIPLTIEKPEGYGAVQENNLETAPIFSIIEELENWTAQLKASPEVTHRLREFEAAAQGAEKVSKPADISPVRRKGPCRSGPSL